MVFVYCFILFVVVYVSADVASLDECFQRDSISCLQMQVYETARNYFQKSNIESGLEGNFSSSPGGASRRQGRSQESIRWEKKVEDSKGVQERQEALEDYFAAESTRLWNELPGSRSWMGMARSLIFEEADDNNGQRKEDVSSKEFGTKFHEFVGEEARGDKEEKKQPQLLMPVLIGIAFKITSLAILTYMSAAVIAKKALLAGLISLIVSGFIATKNLIESAHHANSRHHEAILEPMSVWQTPAVFPASANIDRIITVQEPNS